MKNLTGGPEILLCPIDMPPPWRYEYTKSSRAWLQFGGSMKTWLLTMALAGMMLPLAGCETLTDTKAENKVRLEHAAILNMRQINNDVQYMLYIERPMWLSRYPIPND
jgi:hypothetical protein